MLAAFLHGYLLAFGLILPLGPQNAFVLSQGAAHERWQRVVPVVLAASCSDSLLILLAVLGVSMLVLTLPWLKVGLILAGVLFLVIMGWRTWRVGGSSEDGPGQAGVGQSLRLQVMFTLAVSLLNPHAILDTVGVIGTSALAYSGQGKAAFTMGCVLNSWLWFSGLALAGRFLGKVGVIRVWLNRASALVMWISAIYLLNSLLSA